MDKPKKLRRDKPQTQSDNVQIPKIIPIHTDSSGQTANDTSTNTTKQGA